MLVRRNAALKDENWLAESWKLETGKDGKPVLDVRLRKGVRFHNGDPLTAEQIAAARCGWGHSTPRQSVELAREAGCRRLILFHHEPEHDDEAIDRLLDDTRAFAARTAPGLEVESASEGMEFPL